jgi:hypothetical protein
MSTLHAVAGFRYDEGFCVAIESGNQLLAENAAPIPNAMVIDVEGAEIEVLRGLKSTLADPRLVRVVFEAGNELLNVVPRHPIAALLWGAGLFKIERLARNEHTAHALDNLLACR